MLTLEPFPAKGRSPDQLADDALSGKYDLRLKAHCGALSAARSKVYFRFGHEMDFDNGRYAWSGLSPEKFIAMFRHAVRVCRQSAPQVITVWSPGGDPSLVKYYPGDDIVDLVGLSLFGLEPWEEAIYGRPRSFSEAFGEKYANVSAFGKPVMIAEFGVCGGERYRKAWLSDAIENGRSEFPLLRGVIYFNDREPHRWPIPETILRKASSCDLERPDWRL